MSGRRRRRNTSETVLRKASYGLAAQRAAGPRYDACVQERERVTAHANDMNRGDPASPVYGAGTVQVRGSVTATQ